MTEVAALALRGIRKRFGEVVAVDDATLEAKAGQIHAVVGENGAGKSTLLMVAAGIHARDDGDIFVGGKRPGEYGARRAGELGVAMVQQHFALVDGLTALENIMLGAEPTLSWGRLDFGLARRRAERVLRELDVTLDLGASVGTFGVADKQRVEIVRTLFREARVIILDEPTAVLTPREATSLYHTLRALADTGRAIVVVTHKLDEVESHADVVTVMRRAKTIGTRAVAKGSEVLRLAGELIGSEDGATSASVEHRQRMPGEIRLKVRDLARGRLDGVSFDVRAGEIVGVAGVLGNGQTELVQVLGGLLTPERGSVEGGAIEVVHEDRHAHGMILAATVRDNAVLGELGELSRFGVIDAEELERVAHDRIAAFGVVPADTSALARSLSGGNQQKVVLARALSRDPAVLVIAHATRGVDLGAARAIHGHILAAAARGTAILLVGADLAELRLLSTRILVIARGRMVSCLAPDADDETIGAAMLGGSQLS